MKQFFALCLLIIIIMSNGAFAAIQPTQMKLNLQSLDNYVVTVEMKGGNNAKVTQSFDVVNKYKDPVIPGRAKMVLLHGLDPKNIAVTIGGSTKLLSEADIIEEDGNKVIYYEIWRPITFNERLNIVVSFDTVIETQGILFKQLNLNFGDPELPIEKMMFNLVLPEGERITFSEPPITEKNGNSVVIEIPANMVEKFQTEPIDVEYSSLPLPVLPFHGYWLWLILIVMSAAITLLKLLNRNGYSDAVPN